MRSLALIVCSAIILGSISAGAAETVPLEQARFVDKCKGAWAGQMFGVCLGAPYEFRFNATTIDEDLRPWKPEHIAGSIQQDDCYVEMTFLKALEEHGLDITYEQAGKAFANTEYPLWHANYYGRENVRAGIMPPMSGHPLYNRHADDIDFQIEADLFGILCPGLPQESNRLCEIFGRIMNYGDGLYGGMFVAGMYAAAYFEDSDVRAVLQAGLDCIPPESQYRKCIEDVIAWHDEAPDDWRATWRRIEEKWQDDVDCMPGSPFNIDAKLNGAYIAMGLLYGEGDLLRTAEVSARCGQDSDCNPSNAAGVLGCMKGFESMGSEITSGIEAIRNEKFIHTDYGFDSLIDACRGITEQIIARTGGTVDGSVYHILRQPAQPPVTLEQWVNQEEMLKIAITPTEMRLWDPAWRVVACGHEMEPGIRRGWHGRDSVLVLHPVSKEEPAAIEAVLDVPASAKQLVLLVASDKRGDFVLRVSLNGEPAHESVIDTKGEWREIGVDLAPHAGKTVRARVENAANDWSFEAAYIASIEFR
ncbi:MAG TPA: ADP-ribosylglycohydrolase family protein [Candidatus Hydrogenedentes bacterium]|nr:ADP-ribosylglycohydrolase family protein [Candidatus Hydrogenedentota bacterium]